MRCLIHGLHHPSLNDTKDFAVDLIPIPQVTKDTLQIDVANVWRGVLHPRLTKRSLVGVLDFTPHLFVSLKIDGQLETTFRISTETLGSDGYLMAPKPGVGRSFYGEEAAVEAVKSANKRWRRSDDEDDGGGQPGRGSASSSYLTMAPRRVTMCAAGVSDKALSGLMLVEWLHHHMHVGVDYFVLSVLYDDPEKRLVRTIEEIVGPLVAERVVDLHRFSYGSDTEDDDDAMIEWADRDMMKTTFLQMCLFHAKGISE